MNRLHWKLIDKPTFFGALVLLLFVTLPLLFWPEAGAVWVAQAKSFMTERLGVFYLLLGLSSFFFMVYIFFSDIGQIKLGGADEAPEFSSVSWAAMLFCGGIGASILYWGSIEWVYYWQSPPFQLAPGSPDAIRWATSYGFFHWGFIAWSIYLVPAIPIAYFYYVRRQPALKISTALLPVLGEKGAHGWGGKLVDILFIFGMLGGGATTLGLATPMIAEGLHQLLGIPKGLEVQLGVLLTCTLLFGYSAYVGIERGIKLLSNLNFWGALGLLAFIFAVGPTRFMLETGLDSFGRVLSNFFVMATSIEPFSGFEPFRENSFPQDWTIFYWAWWLVFSPSMGLFIARISRGRTIRNMITGTIFYGSMGCFLYFMVLGNYGLHLQLSGQLDMVGLLAKEGPTATIFAMLATLPAAPLVIGLFTLLALVFTATSFDSISYILASVVQKDISEEPLRWNRLFWAFTLSFLPAVLMLLGGLSTLQTASIVAGAPLLVIAVMLAISTVKVARLDLRHHEDWIEPVINIECFPDVDPWSEDGKAFALFELLKSQAMEAACAERAAREAVYQHKTAMRERALGTRLLWGGMPNASEVQVEQLEVLLEAARVASEHKAQTSQLAQEARMAFNTLVQARQQGKASRQAALAQTLR